MHASALQTGQLFFEIFKPLRFQRVLDIGGRDFNGSLRKFAPPGAKFVTVDLEPGNGVDVVLSDPYSYPFEDGYFDCVVSTSCLEHDRMFWLTILEAVRVLSDKGVLYLNVPSQGAYHGYPYDHWRFYPDAALAIMDWCKRSKRPVRLVESFNHADMPFNDCTMIFAKGNEIPRVKFLHEQIPGTYNIRRGDGKDLLEPKLETPAVALVLAFGEEIRKLRAQLAEAKGSTERAPERAGTRF